MGKFERSCSNKHHDGRIPPEIQKSSRALFKPSSRGKNFRNYSMSPGSLYSKVARFGCDKGNFHSSAPVLLSDVHPNKEKRQTSAHHRPVGSKSPTHYSYFQNGNSFHNLQFHLRRSMGLLSRYRGCLFSRSSGLELSQIPRFQTQRKNICFSIPSFRSFSSSLGIHSSHKTHKTTSTHTADPDLQLSGRLHNFRPLSRSFDVSSKHHFEPFPTSRPQSQLGKIQPHSISIGRVSGRHMGSERSHSFRPSRQESSPQSPLLGNCPEGIHHQKRVGEPDRTYEFCRHVHRARKAPPSSYLDVDESPHSAMFQGQVCSSGWESQGASGYLDFSKFSEQSNTNAGSTSISHLDDRCLPGRLVWDSSPSKSHGVLGARRFQFLHELEGIKGNSAVSCGISVSSEREGSPVTIGQHYSHLLPTSSRLSKICSPTQSLGRNPGILQETVDLHSPRTSQGSLKCSGRPGLPSSSYSDGMVTRQGDIQLDLQLNFPFAGRPFRHKGELSAQTLCVSMPRRPGSGVQRFQLELGSLDLNLPVSSLGLLSGCGVPSPGVQRERRSDSSLLALERVVPSASPALQRYPSSLTRELVSEPNDFEGFDSPQQPFLLEASRLDSLSNPWVNKGLSVHGLNIVNNAHREGTRRQYQSIWKKILEFLALNKIPHSNVTVFVVMNFLSYHFLTLGKKYRTVAAYKCAIAHPLLTNFGIQLKDDSLDLFMRGVFNLDSPKPAPMPVWSLNTLLGFLASDQFEPLCTKSIHLVTQKTLCLMLLASGRRIDEIAHLSKKHEFRQGGELVALYWLPHYVPKHYDRSFKPKQPSLERMASDDSQDICLCPVRALNTYLSMVAGGPRFSISSPLWSHDTKGLTNLFKTTVFQARHSAGIMAIVPMGPHQMRKLAASYSAKMINSSTISEKKLMERMGCSSMNVLKRTYINNVPNLNCKCVLPIGTFIPGNID